MPACSRSTTVRGVRLGTRKANQGRDYLRRREADFEHRRHIGELFEACWGKDRQHACFAGLHVRRDLANWKEPDMQLAVYEVRKRGWNAPVADGRELDTRLPHEEFGAHMGRAALARLHIVEFPGSRFCMGYQLRQSLRPAMELVTASTSTVSAIMATPAKSCTGCHGTFDRLGLMA